MVEMGVDRMYHGFWKLMDPEHRKYEPGNPHEGAILDYHKHVDELMGGVLAHADEDTAILVVSDHGGKRMDGGIRVNEWLRREGLLTTLTDPETAVPLREAGIDWSKTAAWGEGGYYSRIFLNVAGREPEGTVSAGRLRARAPATWPSGSPPSPTRTASRSAPRSTCPRTPTPRSTGSRPT